MPSPAFAWNDSLSVGVAEVDAQHKELIGRVNRLLEATAQGRGRAEIAETIEFLGSYAVSHFRDEERYMQKVGYPGLAAQRAEHKQFLDDFTALRTKLTGEGATSGLVIQVQRQVCGWLLQHINRSDKAIGAFARTSRN